MCTVQLPLGGNPIAVNKYIKGATFNIVLKMLVCKSNKGATLNLVITSHLIFMAQGTSLIDHLPYSVSVCVPACRDAL
jgi:hypothetical protein